MNAAVILVVLYSLLYYRLSSGLSRAKNVFNPFEVSLSVSGTINTFNNVFFKTNLRTIFGNVLYGPVFLDFDMMFRKILYRSVCTVCKVFVIFTVDCTIGFCKICLGQILCFAVEKFCCEPSAVFSV